MTKPKALEMGTYYHIYHRGNNRQPIFFEQKNYRFFLRRYIKYIEPVAFTYAFCLLNNHLHFLIQTRTELEQRQHFAATHDPILLECRDGSHFSLKRPSQQFANLFNSYAKAINKAHGRTGSLFENRFGRKPVASELYLRHLVVYIHRNPQTHGFIADFRQWPWSSYTAVLSNQPTWLQSTAVRNWLAESGDRLSQHDTALDSLDLTESVTADNW